MLFLGNPQHLSLPDVQDLPVSAMTIPVSRRCLQSERLFVLFSSKSTSGNALGYDGASFQDLLLVGTVDWEQTITRSCVDDDRHCVQLI